MGIFGISKLNFFLKNGIFEDMFKDRILEINK